MLIIGQQRFGDKPIRLQIGTGGKIVASKRVVSDCRLWPSEKGCSLTIAGTEEEVLPVAIRHAIEDHGEKDTLELRAEIKKMLREE